MSITDNWNKARPNSPCPICHHESWCLIAKDGGAVLCPRTKKGASKYLGPIAGYLHILKSTYNRKHVQEVEKATYNEILPPDINEKAEHILKDPDLLNNLIKEIQQNVIGEASTIKTILICTSGRLVENSEESSYNLIIYAKSGSGKDYVLKGTLKIYPEGVVESRKTISPKTFTYWHNAVFEPDWTWDGKIFYGEDVPNNVLNDNTFKLMASSGNDTSTIVINGKAANIIVNGKPIMIITTASADLSIENLRRFIICPMDESKSQTIRVKEKLADKAKTGTSETELDPYIKFAMGDDYLQRVTVKIPFANLLIDLVADSLIMRTAFGRFLDYIKASAALHQHQRKHTGSKIIQAAWADYDIARAVILKTTSSSTMMPLSGKDKDLWNLMGNLKPDMPDGWLSTEHIVSKSSIKYKTVINHLNKMYENSWLEKDQADSDIGRPAFIWKPVKIGKLSLPTSQQILNEIGA